jgi:hypothetical protein
LFDGSHKITFFQKDAAVENFYQESLKWQVDVEVFELRSLR